MNLRMVSKYLGHLIGVEAVFLLPAAAVALLYGERSAALALLASSAVCAGLVLLFLLLGRRAEGAIYAREGFVVAGAGWVLVSLLGALPFFFSGEIPNYLHAFFESASGFTTTGASILENVELLSHGMLFWRSFTHWLGGIGVLAFILALVRTKAGSGFTLHLMRAESTGPSSGKITPRLRRGMHYLFIVYFSLSALNLILLLAGGMPLFDAACTMFGTAGTGGFGIKADSMASYSPYLQTVTTVFMALFGVNLSLYFLLVRRQFKAILQDEELRWYLIIIFAAIAVITLNLVTSGLGPFGESLHHSAFTVSSIITTTGFSTANFDIWPQFSRTVLLLLMLSGAMAGSTGGGFKVIRLVILFKTMRAGLRRLLHPNSVKVVHISGKPLERDTLSRTRLYLVTYCAITLLVWLLISLDGLSLETNLSATFSCFNNIGPGLGAVGPLGNYSVYSPFSTLVLTLAMLLGRLEIFPVLLLFLPETWRMKS